MSARRLPALLPEELDDRQRGLYDIILGGPRKPGNLTAADGSLRGPFDPMLRSPEIGAPLQALGGALRFSTALADDLREVAILLCAVAWESPFEWRVHQPLAVAAGVPESVIDAISAGEPMPSTAQRYMLIYDAVREAFGDHAVSEKTFKALHDAFGEREVFELLTIFGYYATIALVLNSYGIAD